MHKIQNSRQHQFSNMKNDSKACCEDESSDEDGQPSSEGLAQLHILYNGRQQRGRGRWGQVAPHSCSR